VDRVVRGGSSPPGRIGDGSPACNEPADPRGTDGPRVGPQRMPALHSGRRQVRRPRASRGARRCRRRGPVAAVGSNVLHLMNKIDLLTETGRAARRLAAEHPDWLPVLEAAVAVAEQQERYGGEFAGALVLEQLRRQGGPRWAPNSRVLVSYGLLEKSGASTRSGRRAYYRMPNHTGVPMRSKRGGPMAGVMRPGGSVSSRLAHQPSHRRTRVGDLARSPTSRALGADLRYRPALRREGPGRHRSRGVQGTAHGHVGAAARSRAGPCRAGLARRIDGRRPTPGSEPRWRHSEPVATASWRAIGCCGIAGAHA
jgi:hypothetical protein